MADVFVLGAGFSCAVSDEMPGTNALATAIAKHLSQDHRFDHLVDANGQLPDADIERWLSRLAERHPFDDTVTYRFNQATFTAVSQAIAQAIRAAQALAVVTAAPPDWLSSLVAAWDRARSTVITFNYDTLIEATYIRQLGENGSLMSGVLLPPGGTTPYVGLWGSAGSAESFALCKLHGSVNWYWHPDGFDRRVVDVGVEERWSGSEHESSSKHGALADRVGARDPFIVPPTSLKGPFLQHETLRHHWSHAQKMLGAASRIWIIGYSLPLTDMVAGALLASLRDSGAHITVVNREPDAVTSRVRSLVPDAEIDEIDGDDAVATFALRWTSDPPT